MKLFKFRPLGKCENLERIEDIIENGFYCCDFLNYNDMNEGVFGIISSSNDINDILSQKMKYKICSFSGIDALKSQLMWGHYANTGMGVVIEIDVDDDCSEIKPVSYSDVFPNNIETVESILTHKSIAWEYEKEFRYLSKDMGDKEKKIIGKITKIYFGTPYERLANFDQIKIKHEKLKKYHNLREKLKKYLNDEKNEKVKEIEFEDFYFSSMNSFV